MKDFSGFDAHTTVSVRYWAQAHWGEGRGQATQRWFGIAADASRWIDALRSQHPDLVVSGFAKVEVAGREAKVTSLLKPDAPADGRESRLKALRRALGAPPVLDTGEGGSGPQTASEGVYDDLGFEDPF